MGEDKLWAEVGGRPLLGLTLQALADADVFDAVVVVAAASRREQIAVLANEVGLHDVSVVEGGERRQDSVAAGLARCAGHEIVCVHDGARPLAPPSLFGEVVEAARADGAAIAAIPTVDTIKQVARNHVVDTLDRSTLVAVQTPQAFRYELLRRAHDRATDEKAQADDDAALVERLGALVAVVSGDPRNFKVTTPFDLELLRARAAAVPT